MRLIKSEYWYQDGFLIDAGDNADMNHEGFAIQAARSMLLDTIDARTGRDDDGICETRLADALREYAADQMDKEDPSDVEFVDHFVKTIADGKSSDERREYYKAMYDAAHDIGDTRDWAIEYLGWIKVENDNFSVQTLEERTYDECCHICTELVELDMMTPEEQDEALTETINVYVADEDKTYSFRLLDFREFTFKEACPEKEDKFEKMPLGPNAQLKQADIDAQPAYYGTKQGD